MNDRIQAILSYWFEVPKGTKEYLDERNKLWFGAAKETDDSIRGYFSKDVEAAERGEFKIWEDEPASCLALILLLDQFSMNIERRSRRCYERSAMATPIAKLAIERGFDKKVHYTQRPFFYLPLEHSELLADQQESIRHFRNLVSDFPVDLRVEAESYLQYALLHFEVIEKYGRFPGRNKVFNRESTEAEKKYLQEGGRF